MPAAGAQQHASQSQSLQPSPQASPTPSPTTNPPSGSNGVSVLCFVAGRFRLCGTHAAAFGSGNLLVDTGICQWQPTEGRARGTSNTHSLIRRRVQPGGDHAIDDCQTFERAPYLAH
eukprot:m.40850 g.40850  ORF g.40850 m.40850 type:complete len:117 (-) comp14030_c0_seq1:88-438(-)